MSSFFCTEVTLDNEDYVYMVAYVQDAFDTGTYQGNGDVVVMKCMPENGDKMWSLMLGSTGADGVTGGICLFSYSRPQLRFKNLSLVDCQRSLDCICSGSGLQ